MFRGRNFVIMDFEGEPARALSERRLKRSVLWDVAGMIRSFHYAAHMGLLKHRPEDRKQRAAWVRPWYNIVSALFLSSYLETVQEAAFVPSETEEFESLLDVFLIEKAVYEIGYGLNNRPDWVSTPLGGLRHLLKGDS
jgi:maltose alpha-D-glucosyltransferase/alpha-amylase